MKYSIAFIVVFLFSFSTSTYSFAEKPTRSLEKLLVQNELEPNREQEAKKLALEQHLPFNMYFPEGIIANAIAIENGNVVYGVITNFANPLESGITMLYDELMQTYNVQHAQKNFGGIILARNFQKNNVSEILRGGGSVLLVPNWTNDNVLAFDSETGDLLDVAFIPSDSGNLVSPKEARLHPKGFITVSDQITDLVQGYDTAGNYLGYFAPAGGVNNSILDNIRGHAYRPNGNLVVCVASGANQNSIAEFDSGGNYIGNFIAAGSGGLGSPFGILFRSDDVLVTGSTGSKVLRYDFDGNFLNEFSSLTSFPQQISEVADRNIAVAYFSTPSGIRIYSATGELLKYYSAVSGIRGVYQLRNGNFLATNAAGIHEIDSSNGNLVRTIYASTNLQFIDKVSFTVTGFSEHENQNPLSFSLLQNYPNPFNAATVIGYKLQVTSFVSIKIYDIKGNEIVSLVNKQ
ncbi:MAG: hypothetical protein FJ218_08940, partial [Ignavibacteria bacterium]|nr:hypothetical protein [Ignavibacteria bacterium]